jgi:large subunit ribosomal protein L3
LWFIQAQLTGCLSKTEVLKSFDLSYEEIVMPLGLIGKKIGMTRIFTEAGESVPVTVIRVENNRVVSVKKQESDGYNAVQVTAGEAKPKQLTKPVAGHYVKSGVSAGQLLMEFRVSEAELNGLCAGNEISIEQFNIGQKVDVQGTSKGKGFAGAVKRWNFRTQDATHGNSLSHRAPGSIGQCQTPGRVFKGKKMAGQLGNKKVSAQTLEIVRIDQQDGLLLIKGAVPGAAGGMVVLKPAVKVAH